MLQGDNASCTSSILPIVPDPCFRLAQGEWGTKAKGSTLCQAALWLIKSHCSTIEKWPLEAPSSSRLLWLLWHRASLESGKCKVHFALNCLEQATFNRKGENEGHPMYIFKISELCICCCLEHPLLSPYADFDVLFYCYRQFWSGNKSGSLMNTVFLMRPKVLLFYWT